MWKKFTADNASPLVLKVKAELGGFPELELTTYRDLEGKIEGEWNYLKHGRNIMVLYWS